MKREEYAARLHEEMSQVHVSPALRQQTLSALKGKEKPIMKKKLSTALVFALVTMLLGTVALAAAGHWGLLDFVGQYDHRHIPENAADYFAAESLTTETEAGVFAVREVYYDGYRAHITMDLTPKDSRTLLGFDLYSMADKIGNLLHTSREGAERDDRTIAQYFADGGYESLWLASVSMAEHDGYSLDAVLDEDGTLTLYLEVTYYDRQPVRDADIKLYLTPIADPAQYEQIMNAIEPTIILMPITLTAHPDASCKTYVCDIPQEFPEAGVRVDRLTIEVMPLDIYATIEYTVLDTENYIDISNVVWFEFIDPESTAEAPSAQRLEAGLSSGGACSVVGDFQFIQRDTLGANELHSTYTLRAYDAFEKTRYETCTFVMHEVTEE